jgi:hypothetical protein
MPHSYVERHLPAGKWAGFGVCLASERCALKNGATQRIAAPPKLVADASAKQWPDLHIPVKIKPRRPRRDPPGLEFLSNANSLLRAVCRPSYAVMQRFALEFVQVNGPF